MILKRVCSHIARLSRQQFSLPHFNKRGIMNELSLSEERKWVIDHMNLIDKYISQNNEPLIRSTYQSLMSKIKHANDTNDRMPPPDLQCFIRLLTYYSQSCHSEQNQMMDQIYNDYIELYEKEFITHSINSASASQHLILPMKLAPLLFTHMLYTRQYSRACSYFMECMNRILIYTNSILNNKQAIMYHDLTHSALREEMEVSLIEAFLNRFIQVLSDYAEPFLNNNEHVHEQAAHMIETCSLMIDVITMAQLYETERHAIQLNSQSIQIFQRLISNIYSLVKLSALEDNETGEILQKLLQNKVQKKMIQIYQYMDRYNRDTNSDTKQKEESCDETCEQEVNIMKEKLLVVFLLYLQQQVSKGLLDQNIPILLLHTLFKQQKQMTENRRIDNTGAMKKDANNCNGNQLDIWRQINEFMEGCFW
jgi:hypothetical protein